MRTSITDTKHALRAVLFVFSFFVCAALIASYVASTLHARSTAVAAARHSAESLALSLSDQASDTFETANELLTMLLQRIREAGLGSSVRARLRDDLSELITTLPRIHRLDVTDARGRFMVSNLSATPQWMPSIANRPYFLYHRRHADLSLHISGPAQSRMERKWVIFTTRRFNRADGTFAGVVIAPIPFEHFEQAYAHVDVGRLGSIALVNDDGTIMMRHPRARIGQSAAKDPLFRDPYRYLTEGSYLIGEGPTAGVLAFHRLGHEPLTVTVTLAESEYLNDWSIDAVKNALTLLVYVSFIVILTLWLNVQLDRTSRAEAELARLALVDGLTGLANRREFDITLNRHWRQAARDRRPVALLMVDVDNFKKYNDTFGHQQGDTVLVAIAGAIAATVKRSTDIAARYGGEEFAVILQDSDGAAALTVAENVRQAVVDLGIAHADTVAGIVTISIGTASIVPDGAGESRPENLIAAADEALYRAKRAGRNQAHGMPTLSSSMRR